MWKPEDEQVLENLIVEYGDNTIPYDVVVETADQLGKSERSVGAKLRAMGATVERKAKQGKSWSDEEAQALADMIAEGKTDVEIAEALGKTVRQVRGKALSMQLIKDLNIVSTATKTPKTFTDEETATLIAMVEAGDYIEDIAEALGKTVRQVRGKLLSLRLSAPQREKKTAKATKVYTDEVVAKVKELVRYGNTAEEISEQLNLNLVGLKSWLGKHGLRTPDMGEKTTRKYSDEDIERLREMAEEGYTVEEAAKEFGKSVQSIRVVAGRNGIKFRKEDEEVEEAA